MRSSKSKVLLESALDRMQCVRARPSHLIKPVIDTRDPGIVKSRAMEVTLPCTPPLTTYKPNSVVYVDEAQFLSDTEIDDLLNSEASEIEFYGLNSSYQGTLFPAITRLIPVADTIDILHGLCDVCGKPSIHTKLIGEGHGRAVIIGDIQYQSTCRECFHV